jgi:hypothetical protein
LRIGGFENLSFFESAILNFFFQKKRNLFCLIPTKISHKVCIRMKVIKIPASGPHSAFQQQISSENASNMPPGVKVVKLSAASTMVTNQRVAYTSQVTTLMQLYHSRAHFWL